ncbi:MAG: hypothetical protein GF334_02920 [Candidatus Altiarchaeales archaeon]|nr:hypothetical protein [Candidatus Altiarchaeales archaeon]
MMPKIERQFEELRASLSKLETAMDSARSNISAAYKLVAEMEASLCEIGHLRAPTDIMGIKNQIEKLSKGKKADRE